MLILPGSMHQEKCFDMNRTELADGLVCLGGVDEFEPEPDGCQIDHAEEA